MKLIWMSRRSKKQEKSNNLVSAIIGICALYAFRRDSISKVRQILSKAKRLWLAKDHVSNTSSDLDEVELLLQKLHDSSVLFHDPRKGSISGSNNQISGFAGDALKHLKNMRKAIAADDRITAYRHKFEIAALFKKMQDSIA